MDRVPPFYKRKANRPIQRERGCPVQSLQLIAGRHHNFRLYRHEAIDAHRFTSNRV
jgi:hypothetical protein